MVLTSVSSAGRLANEALRDLQTQFHGDVIRSSDERYDELRALWNGRYDRHPALILRPRTPDDIAAALRFARLQHLPVAVRGGGHSATGESVSDGGLTIDLTHFNDIRVDPATSIVCAGGGVTSRALTEATQQHGLAVPTGAISSVGIGGLTTGGGFGYLMRKYGLTMDSLCEVEIVTADGQLRRASHDEHPDLFWAVRGGSGNFGIITSFSFQAHAIGTMVLSGPLVYLLDQAAEALRQYREFMATAPDDLTVMAVFTSVPPMEPFPEHLHGQLVLMLDACYVGDIEAGQRVVQPLRACGEPALDLLNPMPYQVRQIICKPGDPG